ncbi:transmembrane protein 130 [Huso huso]|uniref:Transmembrane protein 130 n=1 Tax=Huso huso TaxID=61971 RepID=A0ABR0YUD5_HUSHU
MKAVLQIGSFFLISWFFNAADQTSDLNATHGLTGSVLGELLFYQMDRNRTYIRDRGELATGIPTEVSFLLHDPSRYFRTASFSYTWDLGDGKPIATAKPYIRYNYTSPGNYTMNLQVWAFWDPRRGRSFHPKSWKYNAELKVLDAVKSIEFNGPPSAHIHKSTSLSLSVNGSPPMTLCWVMIPDCVPVARRQCHLVRMKGKTCSINYTFTNTGRYCLSVTAKNDISMLQVYHDITVWQDATHRLLFILPCVALILICLGVIAFSALRPNSARMKHLVEVSNFDFSLDKSAEGTQDSELRSHNFCCFNCSKSPIHKEEDPEQDGEGFPLLQSAGRPVQTYLA